MRKKLICSVAALALLAGCTTTGGPSNNQIAGAGGGALIGAIVGTIVTGGSEKGAVIGALVGTAVGGLFGTWLDQQEQEAMEAATENAAATAKTGERLEWTSASTPPPELDTEVADAPATPKPQAKPETKTKPAQKPKAAATKAPAVTPQSAVQPEAEPATGPAKAPGAASWIEPEVEKTASAASGWVVPTSDVYKDSSGRYCRDMHQVAIKNGETREQDVKACSDDAKDWKIPLPA